MAEELVEIEAKRSEDEDVCPICLCPPSDDLAFVKASCQHEYCIPCVERILLTKPRPSILRGIAEIPDAHLAAPTKGRCPICRKEMSLFDLKDKDGNDGFTANTDIATSLLSGLVYMEENRYPSRAETSIFMYTFPTIPSELPYATVKVGLETHHKRFDEGCHFHQKSRTFHGRLTWSEEEDYAYPERAWAESTDVVFQFSSDLRYVVFGTLIHKPRQDTGEAFPLDGRWRVLWVNSSHSAHIQVRHSTFHFLSMTYKIEISNPKEPKFYWPSSFNNVLQKAVSGVDLEASPKGPSIGQSITWTTNEENEQTIIWTRESFGSSVDLQVDMFGAGGRILKRQNDSTVHRSMPTYRSNTLFGNTFCQGLKVGLASYHFLEEGTACINYEHADCGHWPPLDDGTPVPSHVPFREIHFDQQQRIFRGKIKWQDDFATTWQGYTEWVYEMHFDTEFTCILSGRVLSHLMNDSDDPEEMSTFGFDLIYINAAVKEHFDTIAASLDGPDDPQNMETRLMRRYTHVKNTIRQRLQQESATVRTIATITHVLTALTAMYQPGVPNPIDFNL